MRVVNPQLSVWYQLLSSQDQAVSTAEMKSQASWVTSTMNSLAPMPSNAGNSNDGSLWPDTCRPLPLWANPTTPPCFLAHCSTGRSQVGHSAMRVVPG